MISILAQKQVALLLRVATVNLLRGEQQKVIDELEAAIEIILADSNEDIDDRAGITGMSTNGKNKNAGNSGFSGGCTQPKTEEYRIE